VSMYTMRDLEVIADPARSEQYTLGDAQVLAAELLAMRAEREDARRLFDAVTDGRPTPWREDEAFGGIVAADGTVVCHSHNPVNAAIVALVNAGEGA
jgi:hypothetical protein